MRFLLIILNFFLFLFVAALDIAFLPAMSGIFGQANSSLAIALFLLIVIHPRAALFFYILSTFFIGVTSSSHIILPLALGLPVLLFVDRLFETLFTNRSYYTLIGLGTAGWLLYYLLFAFVAFIISVFWGISLAPVQTMQWWGNILLNTLLLFILYSAAYLLVSFASKRFQSYFITSTS